MYWAEQPFTVTPECVAAFIERRFSPTGPSGNAYRHATAPDYTMTSRIEMGTWSVIAELRATNYWGSIAAERLEDTPAHGDGQAGERVLRRPGPQATMPDWQAWPFPTEDPYPAYCLSRARAPVQWNEQLGAHLVLSYEHAATVLRSPEWSSVPRNSPQLLASLGGPGPVSEQWTRSLLISDPPTHTRLRSAVNRFFTPRAMERIRGRVAAIVEAAFAPLAEGESVELMSELAYPIPLAVIAELFDVGLEGSRAAARGDADARTDARARPDARGVEEIGTAAMTVMLFLVPLVAERRHDPREDLLSALIHPPDGGAAWRPMRSSRCVCCCSPPVTRRREPDRQRTLALLKP